MSLGGIFYGGTGFVGKQLCQRALLKNIDADDLQNLVETFVQISRLLNDGHHQISANGRPDLTAHGILAAAIKTAYVQMLFDPFKEQFDLPALAIELGNDGGRQVHLVGQQQEVHLVFGVIKAEAP